MTIAGRQIREARALLRLQRNELAAKVRMVSTGTIARAESVDDEPLITTAQAVAIRLFFEAAGIEFNYNDSGAAVVRLRKST